ncbi:MAG: tRNA preQ1(34) S-adenosylmethionine ribosyltransferase-isomerase QueA [Candidatus Omnitrophica bacterium]|nr:tRNA preQ1(34) S-adenosylmethionine ribosyltransferase-isomerase QueA [Candidatus Omnitrophota bacterium]
MKISEFDHNLPKELIAQFPLESRDASRLLVLERASGKITHRKFSEITDYFKEGDTLVLNDAKVIPARLFGSREKTGGKVEVFLLEKIKDNTFKTLLNPARKFYPGDSIIFNGNILRAHLVERDNEGFAVLKFEGSGNLKELLEKTGEIPLPPYIKRRVLELDKTRYQTVYARKEGAVAAPTAGLHFTPELLSRIGEGKVNISYCTLNVNYATFKPVKEENVEEHVMYKEYYDFPEDAARIISGTKRRNKKVVAVGTTSCRVLETVAANQQLSTMNYKLSAECGWTDLYIYPPHEFKLTDMLLTNFHFPKSTLLMLIAAFCGSDIWKKAYQEAIKEEYRFYSYGDAMLIV